MVLGSVSDVTISLFMQTIYNEYPNVQITMKPDINSSMPSHSELGQLFEQAAQYQNNGELGKAADLYEEILLALPDNSPAWHNLCVIALAQEDFFRAGQCLDNCLLLAPDEPAVRELLRRLAITLYRSGLWEESLPWLEKALQVFPGDPDLTYMTDRARPRDYLKQEIYCSTSRQTLQRYSPRESETYVYAIDIVGTCNLRCPTCPVGNSMETDRAKGFMELELFGRILDKIDREKPCDKPELFFFNWGEPLLHPRLPEMITMAHEHGYPVTLSTNLNTKTDLDPIIKAAPDVIKISMSGLSEETYGVTHKKGKPDVLKANIFKLKTLLDKYQSKTEVYMGHHLYTSNLYELKDVENFCKTLGFRHAPIQAFFQPLEKVKAVIDGELSSNEFPVLDLLQLHPRERFEKLKETRTGKYDCELRFNQTVINHDGSVALCCGVYEKENMLGLHFLEGSHTDLEEKKYQHEFCGTCRKYQMDYSPNEVIRMPESNDHN